MEVEQYLVTVTTKVSQLTIAPAATTMFSPPNATKAVDDSTGISGAQ